MSLNFLSPVYLFGLLGLAVPVLIHLLTRRQQKKIRFSAVHLLLQSQKRSVRRSAPNRLLLLLVRCLAIVLLSLVVGAGLIWRKARYALHESPRTRASKRCARLT